MRSHCITVLYDQSAQQDKRFLFGSELQRIMGMSRPMTSTRAWHSKSPNLIQRRRINFRNHAQCVP